MADSPNQPETPGWFASIAMRPPSWPRVVLWAFGLRIVAVDLVQWATQRKGVLCVFPDSDYYWFLAGKIVRGAPYEVVDFGNLPRFALRTPGYPLFLAACQWLFGPRVIAARLVQAALGAACVWWVARLSRRSLPADPPGTVWTVPLIAGLLTAVEPYVVANSALLLSEALFVPLLVLTQWGLAGLWTLPGEAPPLRRQIALAFLTGAGLGAAVLVRPSWWLYVPLALGVWVIASGPGRRKAAARGAVVVVVGVVAVMGPWWVRNAQLYGKFVPTALWGGASLYDGLNPRATGASDMAFLGAPEFWPLDEETRDAVLYARAIDFVRTQPGRAAWLAVVKASRFWSPWPNAEGFTAPLVAAASAVVTLPLFVVLGLGLWDRRRDARALALLALPLAYTFALHLAFVSSMRYRVPPLVPALGLAAVGVRRVIGMVHGR
jgi:4-amino-4-deoxy-L-arabinose transferase-like glycosyltransferase